MRLIDADKIVAYLHEQLEFAKLNNDRCLKVAFKHAILKLDNAPTIDVVPVVRCKDCWKRGGYQCPMYHTETCLDDLDGFDDYNVDRTDDDGFCHLGERWEGEEE